MENTKNAYKVLTDEPLGKGSLGRLGVVGGECYDRSLE